MNKAILYTDGACSGNPGPGGWAYVLFNGQQSVFEKAAYVPQTTNNRMEMLAVIEGLKDYSTSEMKKSSPPPLLVLTDSSYVVFGITKWIFSCKKRDWKTIDGKDVNNRDLWEDLLTQVQKVSKIEWKIIPGHSGIPGNERCDQLAVSCQKKQENFLQTYDKSKYLFPIDQLPDFSRFAKRDPYYLSLVNGILQRHKTWSECEARVKGRQGVRFKKIKNLNEEEEIFKLWGISQDDEGVT